MTKVALYLRVSTEEQTVVNQLPPLEAFARSRGWEITEIYQESESAWKAGHQRELKRLLDDIRVGRRKYDILLVWALDRLSRGGPLRVLTLVDTLKRYGCRVVSLQESWTEIDGPLNEVMYSLVSWVARYESERRSERTKAGLERAIREGKKLGRPKSSKDKQPRRRTGYLLRYASPELRQKYSK